MRETRQMPVQMTGIFVTPYIAAYLNLFGDQLADNVPNSVQAIIDKGGFDAAAREGHDVLAAFGYFDMDITEETLKDLNVPYVAYSPFTGMATSILDGSVHTEIERGRIIVIQPASTGDALDQCVHALSEFMPEDFDCESAVVIVNGKIGA